MGAGRRRQAFDARHREIRGLSKTTKFNQAGFSATNPQLKFGKSPAKTPRRKGSKEKIDFELGAFAPSREILKG
jgi:hypothetical protein